MWLCKYIYLFYFIPRSLGYGGEELVRNLRNLDVDFRNVIEGRVLWHDYMFDTGVGNREELVINRVASEDDFNFGQDVTEWQSVNLRDKSYIIGRTTSTLTILTAKLDRKLNKFLISEQWTTFNSSFSAFTVFQTWNKERGATDVILIIALSEGDNYDMIWYRITKNNNLEKVWFWHLHKKVSHLKVFRIGNQQKLLIINEEQEHSNKTTADVYDFVLHKNEPDFWLFQILAIDCTAKTSAINDYGPTIYLSLPQQCTNSVKIFQFSTKFTPYHIIKSENIKQIASFNIGPRSFLAVAGKQPGIYKFTKNGLKKEEISIKLPEVSNFLPIPVKNYRQDVMLIVQYDIDHSTHVNNIVRILLYSDGVFNVHDEVPCMAYGEETHGISCIVDEEWDSGIYGSAVVAVGSVLGIIVARHEMHSGLFMFDGGLVDVEHPMVHQMKKILEQKNRLDEIITEQQRKILTMREIMEDKSEPYSKENFVQEPLRISLYPFEENRFKRHFKYSSEIDQKLQDVATEMSELKQRILKKRAAVVNGRNIKNLVVNGKIEVNGKTNIDKLKVRMLNGEEIKDMLKECVRKSNGSSHNIIGMKIFSNGTVKNVTFVTLNNINASNIAYSEGEAVKITGNLVFDNVLTVEHNVTTPPNGSINDVRLQDEVVQMYSDKNYKRLHFENIRAIHIHCKFLNGQDITTTIDERIRSSDGTAEDGIMTVNQLNIPNTSLKVVNVNGELFEELLKKVHLVNITQSFFVPGVTTVIGNMVVNRNAKIKTLNNLKYPDEYLFKHNKTFTNITGKKTFTGNVSIVELVVNGLVDGVNPSTVLTLTLDQKIPGSFTFADLEVTESLNVMGTILGPFGEEKFINPTLEETNNIFSNVDFKHLEVVGRIIVNNLNGKTMEDILGDIVYKKEENVIINSLKHFEELNIDTNLQIDSNTINDIKIQNLLTKDSVQELSLEKVKGNITIEHLTIHGLLDNMNISQEFENIVKLNEDAFITSQIIFDNNDQFVDIYSNVLNIQSLNENHTITPFFIPHPETNEIVLSHEMYFDNLKGDEVYIDGDFNGAIDGFDLKYFDEYRFSYTRIQNITGVYRMEEGAINEVHTDKINDVTVTFIEPFIHIDSFMMSKFYGNLVHIDELYISEKWNLEYLNENHMPDLLSDVYWMDRNNTIKPNLILIGTVEFEDLYVENLNSNHFASFIEDIVQNYEAEIDVHFLSYKIFQQGFNATNLYSDLINDKYFGDFMLKSKDQEMFANVIVNGNVWIEKNLTTKFLNDVDLDYLSAVFESNENYYTVFGAVSFNKDVSIDRLYINGPLNNVNVKDYLENIVYITPNIALAGNKIFGNEILVNKNLLVKSTINGYQFEALMKQVVLTTQDDHVDGTVYFGQDVEITESLNLLSNLDAKFICGIDIQEWKENAVYLDKGVTTGNFTFESVTIPAGSELYVDSVNDIDMTRLIPLNREQSIDQILVFRTITVENDIRVENLVNGFNMQQEYDNTVMRDLNQMIDTTMIFTGPVTISKAMKTSASINKRNLTRLITTNTNQNLTACYIFDNKITLDSDLQIEALLNDLDLTEWNTRMITTYGDVKQVIINPLMVTGDINFNDVVDGIGYVGGWNISEVGDLVRSKKLEKFGSEKDLKGEYQEMCYKVLHHVEQSKQQIYKFKYLETQQYIKLTSKIHRIHTFKNNKDNFLIINEANSCVSKMYQWLHNQYKLVYEEKTGDVEQYITVKDENNMYLVIRNNDKNNCEIKGVNLWLLNSKVLTYFHSLPQCKLLLKSKIPSTFYSLSNTTVTEYKIFTEEDDTIVHSYRQWNVPSNDYTFNHHGHNLGLSLRSNDSILKLSRKENGRYSEPNYYAPAIQGEVSETSNLHLPNDGEILVMNIGMMDRRRKLVAVARHEQISVRGFLDVIKIYDDISQGSLFHKVLTYKPSCITYLNFEDNGETLLIFLEDQKELQVYEYKGLAGFQKRSSTKIEATDIIKVSLPVEPFNRERKFLLLVKNNLLTITQAVMDGDRANIDLNCD